MKFSEIRNIYFFFYRRNIFYISSLFSSSFAYLLFLHFVHFGWHGLLLSLAKLMKASMFTNNVAGQGHWI